MLSRALISAAVTLLIFHTATGPAVAQNLEAGKSPSQLFSATCALCHKSSRGLLKTVPPGSLAGFLRQHYTTSTDMAAALSAYVLANGASDKRQGDGNLTRQGREARTAPKPVPEAGARPEVKPEARPEHRSREARRPDVERLEEVPGVPPTAAAAPSEAKPEAAPKGKKSRHEKRKPPVAGTKDEPKAAPPETKPTEAKPTEAKPTEAKPAEVKPAETKPEAPAAQPDGDAKTANTDTGSPDAAKPEDGKASAAKPETATSEAPASESAKPESAKPELAKPEIDQAQLRQAGGS